MAKFAFDVDQIKDEFQKWDYIDAYRNCNPNKKKVYLVQLSRQESIISNLNTVIGTNDVTLYHIIYNMFTNLQELISSSWI